MTNKPAPPSSNTSADKILTAIIIAIAVIGITLLIVNMGSKDFRFNCDDVLTVNKSPEPCVSTTP